MADDDDPLLAEEMGEDNGEPFDLLELLKCATFSRKETAVAAAAAAAATAATLRADVNI